MRSRAVAGLASLPLSHDEPHEGKSDIHELLTPHLRDIPVRAARVMIQALVDAGVDTFFGIPGGPAAPVFQAFEEVEGARLIESRQESAAAFAAVGYHRATGRIPAVVVTAGPGATQVVTGIVSASLERVPMIVIAGDVAWSASGGRLLQDSGPDGVAIEEMLAKATRAQVRIARPESAGTQALFALDAALDPERPGPALIVMPMQHGAAPALPVRTSRRTRARSTDVDGRAVREACATLAEARRPLLVIGSGCRKYGETMRRLVDALDVPFVTTPAGKGIVSEEHPRSLRHGGLAASGWARAYTREGVDGCVVLGSDLDDVSIGPTRYVAPGGKLVHVDLDARVFSRNLVTTLGVVCDVELFADAMRLWWTTYGLRHGQIGAFVRQLKADVPPYEIPTARSASVAPHDAILRLQRAFPDAIFATDIGEHMLFALHCLTARGPDRFHIQLGLGSMGSGIGTAIGLALGAPERRVVCVVGDGCMQMMGSEALVAIKERLPIVFAVFNDGRYNMVHHGMKQLYGAARQWDGGSIDFARWASAIGMPALTIERAADLDGARIDEVAHGGPVLLDIRIDKDVRLKGAGRVESLQQMSAHELTGGAR